MNLELNSAQLGQAITRFLHRYHVVLFTLVVIGSLSVATYLLMRAMNPTEDAVREAAAHSKLDADTIKRVNDLSTTPKPLQIRPNKRSDPF